MVKQRLKKFAAGMLCGAMLFSCGPAFAQTPAEDAAVSQPAVINADLSLDGKVPNAQGVLYDGKAWVPLRVVADGLEIAVAWDAETRTATIDDGTRTMEFREGDNLYCSWSSDPNLLGMTAPAELAGAPVIAANGRMWVPAEAFTVLVGYDVSVQDHTVTINHQQKAEKQTAQ